MKSLLVIAALGGTLGSAEVAQAQAMDTSPNRVIVKTAAPAAGAAPAVSNAGVLQLMRELDSLKREVQALRGQVENQSYELEQLRRQQTSAYTDLDRRLQAGQSAAGGVAPLPTLTPASPDTVAGTPAPESSLQVETEANGAILATDPLAPPSGAEPAVAPPPVNDPMAGLAPPPAPPATVGGVPPAPAAQPMAAQPGPTDAAPSAPPAPPAADDASSEAAYRDAFSLLRAGDYDKAIAAFTAFQAAHPGSQYGDNAQYWLAEAYYAKGQYAPAITEYQRMLTQYPGSKKLSHAMLKTGYSYDKLGKAAEASATLKSLIEQYPGSSAARLAEERLTQIKAGKPR